MSPIRAADPSLLPGSAEIYWVLALDASTFGVGNKVRLHDLLECVA